MRFTHRERLAHRILQGINQLCVRCALRGVDLLFPCISAPLREVPGLVLAELRIVQPPVGAAPVEQLAV